jgi:hypothetical protein
MSANLREITAFFGDWRCGFEGDGKSTGLQAFEFVDGVGRRGFRQMASNAVPINRDSLEMAKMTKK